LTPPPTCILGYAQANYPCESLVMLLVGNQILKGGNGNQLYLQEGKMKFSKTLLVVSLAMTFQEVYAQGSIINESKEFDKDAEIQLTESSSEANGRFVGIEANDNDYQIKISQGSSLLIKGGQSSSDVSRVYGISAQNKFSLTLEGNSSFELGSNNVDLRAIRAMGDITVKGSTSLSLSSDSGLIVGLDVWNSANVNISGSDFVINATSESGRIMGIQNWNSEGGVVNLDSENIRIVTDNSNSNSLNQGLLSYQSTTNFNGNTYIEVLGGSEDAYGIDVQCDPGLPHDTVVNLRGTQTKIVVHGKADSVAVRPSGATGFVNITSDIVDLSASSTNGPAFGIRVQYGASLAMTNTNASVNISAKADNKHAIAVFNTTYGGGGTIQFGLTNIEANSITLQAAGKDAFGVVSAVRNDKEDGTLVNLTNENEGVSLKGQTTVNTTSSSGFSIGIVVSNANEKNLELKNKVTAADITVNSLAQNGGAAYAVYLNDNGRLELGRARLSAVSDSGKAVGIYNNGSVVKFSGDSVVQAETALQGNGTVNVETGAILTLDGKIVKDEWTGIINANGKVAYGVAESIAASDLANANDGTLLVIAGTEIAGNVNVGTVMTRDATAASHSLKVGSDGTILVRATDSYDGTSPLIKVDSVRAEKGSTVHLLNAAAVAEGTKVFESNDADEDSLEDYLFTTDNFLKKVENNRIVGEKSTNVFGSDLLIPNVVDAAVNAANNEGADRILGLTNKALTQAQSLKAIHQFALMVPASGAQSTAINVANLQLDVIDTHASKLALHAEDKVGADLWIDLNGFLSKTNDYSAGSAKFGYKSDLAGVTIGSDYSFGNGYAAGVSVAFGKGSVRGQGEGSGVKNDVDYYGVNLYGVWSNDYFNTIGSVGYLQTKNEIKTQGFKGKPDAKTVSVGVRFEKPLALNEAITVTPHLGVRYKHVKLDSFNAGGFKYTTEKADIVEMPFGVAFNANLKAPCGADVKPFVDLTIAPNFGDRKVSNKIALAGTTASDSFDARIANNAMYNAKVGVNAVKGSHTFGLNYGIGGGNRGRVDQTLQARYTYRF
jgi:hypothetical protein